MLIGLILSSRSPGLQVVRITLVSGEWSAWTLITASGADPAQMAIQVMEHVMDVNKQHVVVPVTHVILVYGVQTQHGASCVDLVLRALQEMGSHARTSMR